MHQEYKEWACSIIRLHGEYWEHDGNTVENEDISVIQDCIKCIDKELWGDIEYGFTPLQERVYNKLYKGYNRHHAPDAPTFPKKNINLPKKSKNHDGDENDLYYIYWDNRGYSYVESSFNGKYYKVKQPKDYKPGQCLCRICR